MNKESSATRIVALKTPGMRINPAYNSILRLSSKQSPARESSILIQGTCSSEARNSTNGHFSPDTALRTKSRSWIQENVQHNRSLKFQCVHHICFLCSTDYTHASSKSALIFSRVQMKQDKYCLTHFFCQSSVMRFFNLLSV